MAIRRETAMGPSSGLENPTQSGRGELRAKDIHRAHGRFPIAARKSMGGDLMTTTNLNIRCSFRFPCLPIRGSHVAINANHMQRNHGGHESMIIPGTYKATISDTTTASTPTQ